MKNILTGAAILFITFHCLSQTGSGSVATIDCTKSKLTISGTLYYTSIWLGGTQKDERNLTLIPLRKFKLYIINFVSNDSIPKVMKCFTTNKNGKFSVSLPPGKYGFATSDEVKSGLVKGQYLPRKTQTKANNIINSSEWEFSMTCPLQLETVSIKNLVITNHLTSFCVNCQWNHKQTILHQTKCGWPEHLAMRK